MDDSKYFMCIVFDKPLSGSYRFMVNAIQDIFDDVVLSDDIEDWYIDNTYEDTEYCYVVSDEGNVHINGFLIDCKEVAGLALILETIPPQEIVDAVVKVVDCYERVSSVYILREVINYEMLANMFEACADTLKKRSLA